jgi:2-iminoacetate synthase
MNSKADINIKEWIASRIERGQIERYLDGGKDFIPDDDIERKIRENSRPEQARVRDIIKKAMAIESLSPDETAALINVTDPGLWEEIKDAASRIKHKVYDNRIITFAPLYLGNLCVNNCLYCGFRCENADTHRRSLNMDEIRKETAVLAGEIGHKRLIAVYGEHPSTDVDYMEESIRAIYSVKERTKKGFGQIRRVNVNAAPLSIESLKRLRDVGIGTYQVFQETYNRERYKEIHPASSIKSDFRWRLYCMHRALEAGIDDVGVGALFGLYDWRFEVMGMVYHALELERRMGIGPHTISFPRLEPALNAPVLNDPRYKVSDDDFKKAIMVLRLAVPYAGMILSARESADFRREMIPHGITQIDASTRIGVGGYGNNTGRQEGEEQQFILGDTRTLDEVIRELAEKGSITSFCTAGYRCGRTGECIMELLRSGKEGKFCKLNAILTFREWLDDFACEETKRAGEKVIRTELDEIKAQMPSIYPELVELYKRLENGERDLYF